MNHPSYAFISSEDLLTFRFESIGDHRKIVKLGVYSPLPGFDRLYNLALLDLLDDGTVDDLSISNNQDMAQILATVVQTMMQFFERRPDATISFTGSTPARTRLYRIAISQNLGLAEPILIIEGLKGGVVEPFRSNQLYDAFFIKQDLNKPL